MDREALLQQEITEATDRWDKDCMDQVQLKVGRKIREDDDGEDLFWEIENLVGGLAYDEEEWGYIAGALNRELGG